MDLRQEYDEFVTVTFEDWSFLYFLEHIALCSNDRKRIRAAKNMISVVKRELKNKLEEEFGFTNHPKASKLFELSWEYGRLDGVEAVESYYEELSELLKG